jgi:hypothetical protein
MTPAAIWDLPYIDFLRFAIATDDWLAEQHKATPSRR